ncbi:hypothetical protein C8Q74DRAFT_987862 [Fomes fomentarius]|nr:hypothetical protein C8Q74DRAFT_987862 [Fomes fomentarius]
MSRSRDSARHSKGSVRQAHVHPWSGISRERLHPHAGLAPDGVPAQPQRSSHRQAVARRFATRRQMKKILNHAVAIRIIQRNARIYGELRDWLGWKRSVLFLPLLPGTTSCVRRRSSHRGATCAARTRTT